MEKWHESVGIKVYNGSGGVPDSVTISGRLSPLTNLLLNVFWNRNQEKNIVVAIPEHTLHPIPILAYLYAIKKKKSVIVFTKKKNSMSSKEGIEKASHHNNYYLLAEKNNGQYLFTKVPLVEIGKKDSKKDDEKEDDEKLDFNVSIYLPRCKKGYKKRYIEEQKKLFLEKNTPRILLFQEDNYSLINNLEKIYLEKEEVKKDVPIDVGLLIFEHIDRFINSGTNYDKFKEWLQAQIKNKKMEVIFHLANPQLEFIRRLKNDFPSYIIQLTPVFLKKCSNLKEESIRYFERYFEQKENIERELIFKYNLDNKSFYEQVGDIEICEVDGGNLDLHYNNAWRLDNLINSFEQNDKRNYLMLKNIFYTLFNLSINPSRYKCRYLSKDRAEWKYWSIDEILQNLEKEIENEEGLVKEYLTRFLLEVNCIYNELKECKRFSEKDNSYERIGREYKIIELATQALKEGKVKNVIIATNYREEIRPLKEEINRQNIPCEENKGAIKVVYVHQVPSLNVDVCNSMLIIPGPVSLRNYSLLFMNFKKIILVAYSGRNIKKVETQVSLAKESFEDESILYLKEIYKDLGYTEDILNKDFAIKDFAVSIEKEKKSAIEEDNMGVGTTTNIVVEPAFIEPTLSEKIRKLIEYRPDVREAFKESEVIQNLDKEISELENEIEEEVMRKNLEYCSVKLERLGTNEIKECILPANRTYICIRDGKQEEVLATELVKNDCIVLFEGKERRTVLDLLCDAFDLELSIDKRLISIWKNNLRNFVKDKSHKEAYELYKMYVDDRIKGPVTENCFKEWWRGKTIGPGDEKNLRVIGRLINDEEIIENYKLINEEIEKLRILHRQIGRKMGKIIKAVLSGKVDPTNMSREEWFLYNEINNDIYSILEIKKYSD